MTTSATSIRMDDKLKKEVNNRLDKLGINFNTFVLMAAKQLVAQNRIPFSTEVPNEEKYNEKLEKLQNLLDRADHELKYDRDKATPIEKVAEEFRNYDFGKSI